MLRNRKTIELINRLKLDKIAWLGLRNEYRTLISVQEPCHRDDKEITNIRNTDNF